jgi:hypothetical protein
VPEILNKAFLQVDSKVNENEGKYSGCTAIVAFVKVKDEKVKYLGFFLLFFSLPLFFILFYYNNNELNNRKIIYIKKFTHKIYKTYKKKESMLV